MTKRPRSLISFYLPSCAASIHPEDHEYKLPDGSGVGEGVGEGVGVGEGSGGGAQLGSGATFAVVIVESQHLEKP